MTAAGTKKASLVGGDERSLGSDCSVDVHPCKYIGAHPAAHAAAAIP